MDNGGTLTVRKAWYAGTWYAGEPDALRSTITWAVEQARTAGSAQGSEPVRFAVLPHAGLAYSARGIAHLVVHAPPSIERVLILSPSHNAFLPPDTLSIGRFSAYETPLGCLDAFNPFAAHDGPDATAEIQREHAVEMVLPFLAYLQQRQKQPIAVSMALISQVTGAEETVRLASMIRETLGPESLESGKTMVIASSDFTHYGQRFGYAPFGLHIDATVAGKVRDEDLALANSLALSELGPVFLKQRMGRLTVCGIAAASIVSALAKSAEASGWVADYYSSLNVLEAKATDFVAYGTVLWR